MGTPRCSARIGGVNDDAIRLLISGLRQPAGTTRLLRALGFTRTLQPLTVPPPDGVRRLGTARRSTLVAYAGDFRGDVDAAGLQRIARGLRAADAVRHHMLVLATPRRRAVIIALGRPGMPLRFTRLEPHCIRGGDVEIVAELIAASSETDTAASLRMSRVLDRSRVSARFFRDVVAIRDLVARHFTGVPRSAGELRNALALLLLSRLMFLYFLQRRGVLDSDPQFLPRLLGEWRGSARRTTFYRGQLRTLFFGVLNRQPAERTARARTLGVLPYLNGGLFELHRLEATHRQLDVPDVVMQRVFSDLLEKYRFTSSDVHDDPERCGADVDPEMLGRIFERLMPGEQRDRTGTFYTPADTVDRVVGTALAGHLARRCSVPVDTITAVLDGDGAAAAYDIESVHRAAAEIRVLDPACGSGAFLLGALGQLVRLRAAEDAPRLAISHDVVAHALHGVDLLEDAALICSLRLWLALVPPRSASADVQPLPNLDRRIRQGDALVDPLDLGITGRALDTTAPPGLRDLVAGIGPMSASYLSASPAEKPGLRRDLEKLERALALAWLSTHTARLDWDARELAARATDTDLFGEPTAHAASARRQLDSAIRRRDELREFAAEIAATRQLPFFSFRVHFAEAAQGFDLIVSNPPWIRAHNWPPAIRRAVRDRFQVCARAGWAPPVARAGDAATGVKRPTGSSGQVDLSLLFLEKSMSLLNERGTLAMLLPAKVLRSLYAGGARELLLSGMELSHIEDHSLDHRSTFEADAFTSVVIAHRASDAPPPPVPVRIVMRRAGTAPLEFCIPADDLPLYPGDLRSPWLIAPPECRVVLRRMQERGVALGSTLDIRRGIMTGANDVLLVRDVEPKIGNLARVRTEGHQRASSRQTRGAYAALVEADCIRPVVRGTDVAAWSAGIERHLLWAPGNDDVRATTPPRLARFLHRHRARIGAGDGAGVMIRPGSLPTGHRVVWSDLASDLRAAALPVSVRGLNGRPVPVVPLNTVYYADVAAADDAMLLAALLNALPVRVFARAIAERAKDAHFRFFAWTMALVPLPPDWRRADGAGRLIALARTAHARQAMLRPEQQELDAIVARAFGLSADELLRLQSFDAWLSQTPTSGRSHERIA
jgi:hypothetical protein